MAPKPAHALLNALADRIENSKIVELDKSTALTTHEMALIELALRDYAKRFQ